MTPGRRLLLHCVATPSRVLTRARPMRPTFPFQQRPSLLLAATQLPLAPNVAVRCYRSMSDASEPAMKRPGKRERHGGNGAVIRGLSSSARALEQLIQALRAFEEREGHFAVPFQFVVPASRAWPKEIHRLPLGVKLHRFMQTLAQGRTAQLDKNPQAVAQLRELGFPLDSWRDYFFEQVCLPALRTYAQQYGDLFVPQKFTVPKPDEPGADDWPRATRGYKLGLVVAKMRKQMHQQQQREQQQQQSEKPQAKAKASSTALPPLPESHVAALNTLGFVWHVRDAKWHQFFLPGLRLYRELYGHADVPMAFVIPSHSNDPRWPASLGGYLLGRHVYMVRSGKYAAQVQESAQELDDLGFSFCVAEKTWNESIFPSLKVFVQQFGHCEVHQDFVVPAEEPWPADAYGLKLGDTVKNIRRGAYASHARAAREELEELGFIWSVRDHRQEKTVRHVVLPALNVYRRLHGEDVAVPTDFVVPEQDANWPVLSRGYKLGQWVTRVRSGQLVLSPKLRAELDALGFVWRYNDTRWHKVLLPAFRVYAELHGGSCASMNTKFVVPREAPYPRASWGVNLGGVLWHIRNGDSYVGSEGKQRVLYELGVLPTLQTAA